MDVPIATYRVQLNADFNFKKLAAVLPYLSELGISHVYASPIFQAQRGSSHGYDIVDPNRISSQLGGEAGFEEANNVAAECGIRWVQDIVPNHAAYSMENQMIFDLFLNGMDSRFCRYFDIDWENPSSRLRGKILAPFLEEPYVDCLEQRSIQFIRLGREFAVKYKELEFPLTKGSYSELVNFGEEAQIDAELKQYNSNFLLLDGLLSRQVYALDYWQTVSKRINYRRFFDIAGLIGVCVEDPLVFDATHQLISRLLKEKKIAGVRVDHIDGLYEPELYLERLRNICPDAYIVVEKILGQKEQLPPSWPVEGTTGYDFLNQLNGFFVEKSAEEAFSKLYKRFSKCSEDFSSLLYSCRKKVIQMSFMGDIDNLARLLKNFLLRRAYGENCTQKRLSQALVEVFACFPIYRTYVTKEHRESTGLFYFQAALKEAKLRNDKIVKEICAIDRLLHEVNFSSEALEVIMRIQQFTGAAMAKGFEDTALYVYCRLLSLNEVGGNPSIFGISKEDFHRFNQTKQLKWHLSMNATATHDTKRGEDARARLNVLSEIPNQFAIELRKWRKINKTKKILADNSSSPDGREEYFIYQTLLGSLPFDLELVQDFVGRVQSFMVKSLREAKIHSSWLLPNFVYEDAVTDFVHKILDKKRGAEFLGEFLTFQKEIAFYGILNSLAQVLLKLTSPGVPDFYQGTELWDLNLVDPDNRRSVDFRKRKEFLEEFIKVVPPNPVELLKSYSNGKVKLYVTHKLLAARRNYPSLFTEGSYIPLGVKGSYADHVFAFCRKIGSQYAISVASRFLTGLLKSDSLFQEIRWGDTRLCLPSELPKNWVDVFTENEFAIDEYLPVSEILTHFPIALLIVKEP